MACEGLEALYRATTYRVLTRQGAIDLRIGRYSAAIARLHAAYAVSSSVLVSAGNPCGRLRSAAANEATHRRLLQLVRLRAETYFPALGIPDSGDWPSERSLLILGTDLRRAHAWCRLLRQNAVLWIAADAVPQLCWHRRLQQTISSPDRCSSRAVP